MHFYILLSKRKVICLYLCICAKKTNQTQPTTSIKLSAIFSSQPYSDQGSNVLDPDRIRIHNFFRVKFHISCVKKLHDIQLGECTKYSYFKLKSLLLICYSPDAGSGSTFFRRTDPKPCEKVGFDLSPYCWWLMFTI